MIDIGSVIQTLIISIFGAGAVKLMDYGLESYRADRLEKKEKAEKIGSFLADYAELTELFRFFARREGWIVQDEEGDFVKDEAGRYITEERNLVPKERYDSAMQALQGTDLKGAVAQKVVNIRLKSGEMFDLADQLDPSKNLRSKLGDLHLWTVSSLELRLEQEEAQGEDYDALVDALQRAVQTRREARAELRKHI